MKKVLISLAVGTALVVPQMPASAACIHANPPEVHIPECVDAVDGPSVGGCGFVATTDQVAGEGQMTGEIDIEAVVYSANPADNPMSATFTCYIKVNGTTQPGAVVTATGTVVVVGGGVVTYTSNSVSDFVQLCQDVSYSNGTNTSECFEADGFEILPPVAWEILDGAVCPLPDGEIIPGVMEIVNGDLLILGKIFYDCPPYSVSVAQRWIIYIKHIVP